MPSQVEMKTVVNKATNEQLSGSKLYRMIEQLSVLNYYRMIEIKRTRAPEEKKKNSQNSKD